MDFSFLENPNVGAIASKIERTRCGDFVMEDSVSLDTLVNLHPRERRQKIVPVDVPLRDIVTRKLELSDRTDLNRFRSNILEIPFRENKHDLDESSLLRVYCPESRPRFVGLAKWRVNFSVLANLLSIWSINIATFKMYLFNIYLTRDTRSVVCNN